MRWIQQKKRIAALAVAICFLTVYVPAAASQSQIDETRQEIDRLEGQQQEAGGRLEALQQDEAYLDGRIKELNAQLASLAEELTSLEQQILEKEQSIADNEALLAEARQEESRQYEDMKLRIRFLYERGDTAMLEQLFSAESFADILNFGRYVESIHTYDRQMLQEYRAVKEEIVRREETLLAEREELVAAKIQQEAKQQEASQVLAQVQESLSDTQGQISATQGEMAKLEEQLNRQKAYEAELERQKEAAEKERLAQEKAREEQAKREQEQQNQAQNKPSSKPDSGQAGPSGQPDAGQQKPQEPDSQPEPSPGSADDTALLAAIIECEAGGESYEGKLAVGSVVMNRVHSASFPNSVMGVIYQRGQFSPVASGRFATVLSRGASGSCVQAAQETLGGHITVDCLYFRVNTGTIQGLVIGNHVFY